jgi:hypothetical protein
MVAGSHLLAHLLPDIQTCPWPHLNLCWLAEASYPQRIHQRRNELHVLKAGWRIGWRCVGLAYLEACRTCDTQPCWQMLLLRLPV